MAEDTKTSKRRIEDVYLEDFTCTKHPDYQPAVHGEDYGNCPTCEGMYVYTLIKTGKAAGMKKFKSKIVPSKEVDYDSNG